MASACSVPRLVRCRVRDLASCFYACRLPFEEEPDSQCSKPPSMPYKSTVLNSKRGVRGHETRKKTSIVKKTSKEEGESVQSSSLNNSSTRVGGTKPSFSEEDYIVFCFREDGAIHMIDECKSSQIFHENIDPNPITTTTTSHRPISKVHRGERVERSRDCRREGEYEKNEEEIHISDAKQDDTDDEKSNRETESDEAIKDINPVDDVDLEEPNAQKMESFESCDSNLSDASTTSFAFPVLSIEWMGSPVHMPKSENHQMCLHCCRF